MMDPLSEVLEGIHLTDCRVKCFELASPWGIRFVGNCGWFHAVTSGACLLSGADLVDSLRLDTGDWVILPLGVEHRMQDRLTSPIVMVENLLPLSSPGCSEDRLWKGKTPDAVFVSGCFRADLRGHPLHSAWPPLIHMRERENHGLRSSLDYVLRLIQQESASILPGSQTIINRLARVLFMKAVQSYVTLMPDELRGTFKALLDPEIGPALALMHRRPSEAWTLAALAESVSMSRSVFSSRFVSIVGVPPGRYLMTCRMLKACELLRESRLALEEIASRSGYDSAAAFSKAFKRWTGLPPGDYRCRHSSGN